MTETKFVYAFEEGKKEMKALLGGKGANLADMTTVGLPVPPGFTISTESCAEFYKLNKKWPAGLDNQVEAALQHLEKKMGLTLGDPEKPLLVSVRSGAAASMPGMMDTILNLGMNDKVVEGVAKKSKNERFAWDSYRRFMQMFGNVVLGVDHDKFEHALESVKSAKGVNIDTDLNADDLKKVVVAYREVVKKAIGKDFPQDAREQLKLSINAVFESWNNKRAIAYRRLNQIQGLIGTAVNVQSMVFGNMGETSGTGVAFTRDPSTGENKFYGEFLMNAQGEDVVAGIRTPQSIEKLGNIMPECYKQLLGIRDRLEKHYKDMQDIEFTIQEGKLFMLQTRNGKRTAAAAVKIAVDLVDEKICTKEDALLKIDASGLNQLLHKQLDPVAATKATVVATGLPASPGAAVGRIVFSAEKVQDWVAKGEDVILVRQETSPEDIEGMNLAKGILTARGGMTSHAAVVARGMGRCCVAGCGDITVKGDAFTVQMDGKTRTFSEGDWLSLDGGVGKIYEGKVGQVEPKLTNDLQTVLGWADATRKLKVRTNADTPKDAEQAIKFGAEGIGLCRTEHMFFEGERIKAMREMILSADLDQRRKALGKLLPFQRQDFVGLYKIMKGKPVTIRLLDPPLHEFLPHTEAEMKELAKEMGITLEKVKARSDELHEMNPMLGHRGCRLGITFPEITEMQARAIFEAAMEVKKQGIDIVPEVMIPLVGNIKELTHQKEIIDRVAREVLKGVDYMVGTMIEVPRAAVIAGKLATEAQFFSFGTNDLTQMTLGFSRDDAGKFLPDYIEKGVLETDPFQTVDQEGVGWLMKHAVTDGRATRVDMKCGICGEHGGDPQTIEFCHKIGLDYVSCSPFRVPIARLAAAQAAVKGRK